jgi:apolipoprotein N-acyltransferase
MQFENEDYLSALLVNELFAELLNWLTEQGYIQVDKETYTMTDIYSLIWLAIGGGLRFFDFGRWTIPLAAWLAPVFLIHFAHLNDPLAATVAIWLILMLAGYFALRGVIPLPRFAYPIFIGVLSVLWTLPYLADRLLFDRLPGLASTLVFPLAWVVYEFIMAKTSPFGTWGTVAYTQYGNRPLMQLASVTGLSGISFLVTWFGAVVNFAWDRQFQGAPAASALILYGVILGLVLLAGGARLAFSRYSKTVRMAAIGWPEGLVGMDTVWRVFTPKPLEDAEQPALRDAYLILQDYFLAESRREARAGAKIVLWPEINLMVFRPDEDAFMERARQLAREEHVYLLMGIGVHRPDEPRPLENKAVLVDPAGEIAFSYMKTHPVPGIEAMASTRGNRRPPTQDTEYGRLATVVCYDMDFPPLLRHVGRARADIILVPASDGKDIVHLHHVQAVFRAVENGVSMLRAARWGLSSAVDPLGRTLATMDDSLATQKVMVAQLPTKGVATIYSRIGDLFAWLCVAGLLGAVVLGLFT